MIESRFSLLCNQCLEPFVHEGSPYFDLAFHSFADVRKLAKSDGWKTDANRSDLCPTCWENRLTPITQVQGYKQSK